MSDYREPALGSIAIPTVAIHLVEYSSILEGWNSHVNRSLIVIY